MGQCSNAMKDDEVDAATHMKLNNPTDYNFGLSSEEEEVQEKEIPNMFAQSMLPKDNKLVENFYEAKKCSKEISLPIKKIHACKKHCMLFYDVDASLTHCRWCGTSRYKSGERKVHSLVLTYMPIADRLQMIYMSEKLAKDMTWHADHKTADGRMRFPGICNVDRHNLDVMHIEKNVFENISNTVMDTSKTKDNIKARMDIKKYCDRADLHVWKQNNKVLKTKASYTLSKPLVKKILSGSEPRNEHLKDLAYGPINEVTSHKGYIVNGYKFHTLAHGSGRVTNNIGVCVKGSCYNEEESDYYGELEKVIEDLKDWWVVVKAMPRGIFQVAED
uniref:Uncharacterized protein n=1 Tax=Tanacetum cinerariifolium TaxID=118510 RepID=A0A699IFT8_TANCI|nr:hypothetical protein [Tanacetum cinerariifolium]